MQDFVCRPLLRMLPEKTIRSVVASTASGSGIRGLGVNGGFGDSGDEGLGFSSTPLLEQNKKHDR